MGDVTPMPPPSGPTAETLILTSDEWALVAQMRGVSEQRARRQSTAAARTAPMGLTEREASIVHSARRAEATTPYFVSAEAMAIPEPPPAPKGPLLRRIWRFLLENDPTRPGTGLPW